MRGLAVAGLLLASAQPASAQVVRGTVTDSVSQLPIPGAVVTLLDGRGQVLQRTLSTATGQYAVMVPAGATRMRVVRIGWRPRERALPALADGSTTINLQMSAIPTFLQPARVDAKQCPKRSDSEIALGLWEQVRDGLVAMVVAREQNLGSMVLLDFERVFRDIDKDEAQFTLKRTQSTHTPNSYRAARSALNFILYGFASAPADSERVYFAPDAEVLIDPGFADGYCFRIVRADRSRPNQVGLGFNSPDRRAGRIDVDGALWVDTVAKAVREIDFRYIGIHDRVDELRPGGSITFQEMPNGTSIIQRWQLRLIGTRKDSIPLPRGYRLFDEFYTTVGGGELAHARWPDGTAFDATLGKARFTLQTPEGAPATGRVVGLANTPYAKTLDASGIFDVDDLLPGTYALIIGEPRLAPLGMDSVPTLTRIAASRGVTALVSATIPSLEQWTSDRCAQQGRLTPSDTTLILTRLLDPAGRPVPRATFKVDAARRFSPSDTLLVAWETILDDGRSDVDGMIQACTSKIHPLLRRVRISGRLPDGEPYQFVVPLGPERLTVAPLVIPRLVRQ